MYPGGGCVLPAFQDGTRLDLGIVRYAEGGLCSYIFPDCSLARAQLVVLTENVQTTALIPDATPRARSQTVTVTAYLNEPRRTNDRISNTAIGATSIRTLPLPFVTKL